MSEKRKSYYNPADCTYVDESFSRGNITSERLEAKPLTKQDIEKAIDRWFDAPSGIKWMIPKEWLADCAQAIHAALPPDQGEQLKELESDKAKLEKRIAELAVRNSFLANKIQDRHQVIEEQRDTINTQDEQIKAYREALETYAKGVFSPGGLARSVLEKYK